MRTLTPFNKTIKPTLAIAVIFLQHCASTQLRIQNVLILTYFREIVEITRRYIENLLLWYDAGYDPLQQNNKTYALHRGNFPEKMRKHSAQNSECRHIDLFHRNCGGATSKTYSCETMRTMTPFNKTIKPTPYIAAIFLKNCASTQLRIQNVLILTYFRETRGYIEKLLL